MKIYWIQIFIFIAVEDTFNVLGMELRKCLNRSVNENLLFWTFYGCFVSIKPLRIIFEIQTLGLSTFLNFKKPLEIQINFYRCESKQLI